MSSDWRIAAVGRIAGTPEAALFARYAERLRPALRATEIAEGRGSTVEIKRREAAGLLAAVPADAFVVALDLGGTTLDSAALAVRITRWRDDGLSPCFVIGGAEGLDASALRRADFILSFGAMTWPHLLARAMLAEQVFRAQAIAAGHPYHRAGRPGG